jgi:hypothetical protein
VLEKVAEEAANSIEEDEERISWMGEMLALSITLHTMF